MLRRNQANQHTRPCAHAATLLHTWLLLLLLPLLSAALCCKHVRARVAAPERHTTSKLQTPPTQTSPAAVPSQATHTHAHMRKAYRHAHARSNTRAAAQPSMWHVCAYVAGELHAGEQRDSPAGACQLQQHASLARKASRTRQGRPTPQPPPGYDCRNQQCC